MIVLFPPGGTADVTARIVAERMRVSLGQPVVIENVTGAGGTIGAGRVARAAPDGSTIMLGSWGTHVVAGAMQALPYSVTADFEPIALIGTQPLVLVSKPDMPAKDLQELIAWLKANPDKASLATAGMGSVSHIAGVLFQKQSGTRQPFVPYRGAAVAMQDLMAGQVDMMFDQPVNALPLVRDGRLKGYAITAKNRMALAPNLPSVDEAGLPGFYVSQWNAIWAPKGTPDSIVARLNAAVVEVLDDPAVRGKLTDLGQEMFPRELMTPAALGAFHKAEIEKWWPIIKAVVSKPAQ